MRLFKWLRFAYIKLKVLFKTTIQWIVGYFLLCRDCEHCERQYLDIFYHAGNRYSSLTCEKNEECLNSITYKYFERKKWK